MSIEENKAIARRFLQVWCKGNLDTIDELADPSFAYHNPEFPPVTGREAFKKAIVGFRSKWPNSAVDVEEEVAEDDKVVIRWTCSGIPPGSLSGSPSTGKRVTWTGITMYRLSAGRIVEQTDVEARH